MGSPTEFWERIPIEPIKSLEALHNAVLERTTKRMPKWKFRVSVVEDGFPTIIMALQPKVILKKFGSPGFEGDARMVDSVGFYWDIKFRLLLPTNETDPFNLGTWKFRAWSVRSPFPDIPELYLHTRDSLIDALGTKFTSLRPEMMFQPACLICGKALTDPISQARWIGPECNRSASALNPFLLSFKDQSDTKEITTEISPL